jgi:hypothetical protein
MTTRLTKAQSIALKNLSQLEAALLVGDWSAVRTAAIQIASVADNRAQRETK